MPVDLPKLGPRGVGVFGARTGPSIAANLRDANTIQEILEREQLAAETNAKSIQNAIDKRREDAKLPPQKFESPLQALHEMCRIVRFQADALVEERKASTKAAKVYSEFADNALKDIKVIADTVKKLAEAGGDGGVTENEVKAAVTTGCNSIQERLDRLDREGGAIAKGFADLQAHFKKVDGASDIRGLLTKLQEAAEMIQKDSKIVADAQIKSLQELLEAQKNHGAIAKKAADEQQKEMARASLASNSAAEDLGNILTSTAAHAKVTAESAKKIATIVSTTANSLKKISDIEQSIGDTVKHEVAGLWESNAMGCAEVAASHHDIWTLFVDFQVTVATAQGVADARLSLEGMVRSFDTLARSLATSESLEESRKSFGEKAQELSTGKALAEARSSLEGMMQALLALAKSLATSESLEEARKSHERQLQELSTSIESCAIPQDLRRFRSHLTLSQKRCRHRSNKSSRGSAHTAKPLQPLMVLQRLRRNLGLLRL
jgi:hypothetical protein